MSYQYHKPTDEQIAQMQNFRDKFDELHKEIVTTVAIPDGDSLNHSLKALREASMWLNVAITNND